MQPVRNADGIEVQNCDLWAGLLDSLESKFGAKPSGVTVRRQLVLLATL